MKSLPSYSTCILTALVFPLVILNLYFTLPCHDLAWLSWVSSRLLEGKTLYRDILEPAPPLIVWMYALPVAIAKHFAWREVLVIRYSALMLSAASIIACAHILKCSSLWNRQERRSLILGITGILLLLADNYVVFGQREHLLIIFILPYLLSLLPSIPPASFSRPIKIMLGTAAALGLCIKPYFYVIWAAALAWRLWRTRSLRAVIGPAEIVIVVITLCYLAAIALFTPQYLDWLRIFAPIYGEYGYAANTTFSNSLWFVGLAVIGIVLAWAFGLRRAPADTRFLMAAAAGAYLEALLQFKTWDYIAYPFEALGMLALLPAILRRPANDLLGFAVMALAFFPLTPLNDARQDEAKEKTAELSAMLAPYHSPDLYYIGDYMAAPMFYRDAPPLEWKNRINSLNFFLFGIMERSAVTGYPVHVLRPGQQWRERWLLDSIAGDIEQTHPHLLVIASKWDTTLPAEDQYLNLAGWLAEDKKFVRILSHYRLAEEKDACPPPVTATKHCLYQIYTSR